MELIKITDRISYLPGEQRTDRPLLYYIRGDRYSVAVDAGNSRAHVELFYSALTAAGLPLPKLTVLTHWHELLVTNSGLLLTADSNALLITAFKV